MSLDNIPEISYTETDVKVIFSNIKTTFEAVTGRTLYPGDPLLILIQTFATIISQQSSKLEYIAKQNLLKYSDDGFIENLGALVGVTRLQPSSALTTLKFTISAPHTSVILISKGTRVVSGNKIYFVTTENIEIPIGETEAVVTAECETTGSAGNDFLPGEINQIVDLFDYYKSVENTTTSAGGSDVESLESFRKRVFDAPKSFSVAGPHSSYKFWAMSTNPLISDVSVYSPTPGVVELIPLLQNGELPTDEILQEVYDYCNADEIRPLTDFVEVKAPEIKNYNINLTYYINKNDAAKAEHINALVTTAVNDFILWQKTQLGRDINPSRLYSLLMATGIKRVEVTEPVFTTMQYNEVAVCDLKNIAFGGLENE